MNRCCFLCRWRKVRVAKEFSAKQKDFFCQKNNSQVKFNYFKFKIVLVSKFFSIYYIKLKIFPKISFGCNEFGEKLVCYECVNMSVCLTGQQKKSNGKKRLIAIFLKNYIVVSLFSFSIFPAGLES